RPSIIRFPALLIASSPTDQDCGVSWRARPPSPPRCRCIGKGIRRSQSDIPLMIRTIGVEQFKPAVVAVERQDDLAHVAGALEADLLDVDFRPVDMSIRPVQHDAKIRLVEESRTT